MTLMDHHRNGEADGWLGFWLISRPEQRLRTDPEVPGVSWEGGDLPSCAKPYTKGLAVSAIAGRGVTPCPLCSELHLIHQGVTQC